MQIVTYNIPTDRVLYLENDDEKIICRQSVIFEKFEYKNSKKSSLTESYR